MDHITRAQQALQALAKPGYYPQPEDTVVDLDSGIVGTVTWIKANGQLELNCEVDPDLEAMRPTTTAARVAQVTEEMSVWSVEAEFMNEGDVYGREGFRVVASDRDAAYALAGRISESSTYDDDRLPDRHCFLIIDVDHSLGFDDTNAGPSLRV